MKFPVAYRFDRDMGNDWAQPGEPVVPNFPTAEPNTFIGLKSYKPAYYAVIKDIPLDLDELLSKLCQRFQGLPKVMLSAYITESAVTAAGLPAGLIIQLFTDGHSVAFADKDTHDVYKLWDEIPINGVR